MPENIKLSALTESTDEQMRDGALMLNSVIDSGSSTGFSSKKTTFSRFANYILNKFTGLSLAGENQTVKEAVDGIKEEKADKSGTYDNMMVGTSKQLLSESYTIDRTPYKFRRSPYTDRLSESIVGASVAFNQLVENGDFSSGKTGWVISNTWKTSKVVDGTLHLVSSANQASYININRVLNNGAKVNHVYVFACSAKASKASAFSGAIGTSTGHGGFETGQYPANTWTGICAMIKPTTYTNDNLYIRPKSTTDAEEVDVYLKNIRLFDLTAMFGTTVADALYNMGDEGIKLFRSWYPSTYYPYSAPTLEHVSGLEAHEMVEFNQWDEEWELGAFDTSGEKVASSKQIRAKNKIHVLPSTTYYCQFSAGSMNLIAFYDADESFISATYKAAVGTIITPSNAYYMAFQMNVAYGTTYKHDICINLSDPTRNGQYKPYSKHSYALDASLTLRGLLKYDATKGFYADGDVYKSDGTVTRKYGIRAYQSGDESNTAVLTDGANTVYKLATPTTETAEPFEEIQITDGTEEYVTDCLAPVGHESKYYANLRSKIEGLPTDFSAIICATEATNKASKNYAVGDYLIYNNTLYKVTTAIASGASLTVGTNITATTIMAEIKALQ